MLRTCYRLLPVRLLIAGCLLAAYIQAPLTARADVNDFVEANMRVDQNSIYKASAFSAYVQPISYVYSDNPYGTGWLGLFLGNFNGSTYSGVFTQAGVIENNGSFHWLVYSEAGVNCLFPGSQTSALRCDGDNNQFTNYNQNDVFTLYRDGSGVWYAALWYYIDTVGWQSEVLARIYSSSPYVYYALVDTEGATRGPSDLAPPTNFGLYHPQYLPPGGSALVDWQGSAYGCTGIPPGYGPNRPTDCFYTTSLGNPSPICPYYNGIINILGDKRWWVAGATGYSSGYVCAATFYDTYTG